MTKTSNFLPALGMALALALVAPPATAETGGGAVPPAAAPDASAPASRRLPISPSQREALGIAVARPEVAEAIRRPPLPGRVSVPNDRARVVATRVAGVVTALEVATGDVVGAGQPLARIEGPEFVALQRALLEARSDFDLAEREEARERQLVEEGIIAGRRAVASAAQLRQARAVLDERRHALGLLGLDAARITAIEDARTLQRTLDVRAPMAGVVLDQFVQVGEQLDAGAPLYRVGALDALQVEVHVPLELAGALEPGSPVRVLEAGGASGRILSIGGDVHALDQGVLVRVALEGGGQGLRPGQFVRVELGRAERGAALFAVPDTALTYVGGAPYVFREAEGGFEPVRVRVVGGSGQRLIVDGPLAADRPVVVAGTAALKAYWLAEGGPR